MAATYDVTKPRYTVCTHRYPNTDFEVLSEGEVAFWRSLGYTVKEHRWNGSIFVDVN
jgi:hypothetical protein